MDEHKIAFIMCINDELYEKECVFYLEQLKLPQGFTSEIIEIREASSMASGYNEAMNQSDAKYKVYLHQDVFIVHRGFIHDIIRLFHNPEIGMIGIVGGLDVDKMPIMWNGERLGMLHTNSVIVADSYLFGAVEGEYREVQAVDGLLMATQYDIPWRADIFRRWDFYDVSQSIEFRKRGYRVVVPHMEEPWCIHDDGILNLEHYYEQLDVFLEEYINKERLNIFLEEDKEAEETDTKLKKNMKQKETDIFLENCGKDDKKICFIMCCNNMQYQEECASYLQELEKPEGFEIEIVPVIGAKSMVSGYNQGMQQSDAKYKVYLHQDVFIWNRRFMYDLLEIFENEEVGLFGVLGGNDIPDDGVLYSSWNVGMSYACDTQDAGIKQGNNPAPGTCQEVEAIDGMLMAAQYDIPWREDLFGGWDFYDISQSFEFRKQGYLVVVPYQEEPWCMHDCGRTELQNYDEGRKTLLREYVEFFRNPSYRQEDFSYNQELKEIYGKWKTAIIQFMERGDIHAAGRCCGQYDDSSIMDSDLSILKKLVSVCETEVELYGECRTWHQGETYESVLGKYHWVKFMLWNMERNRASGRVGLEDMLQQDRCSMPLLVTAGIHNSFHFEEILRLLVDHMEHSDNRKDLQYLKLIIKQVVSEETGGGEI